MLQKPSDSFFYRRRYDLAFMAIAIALFYFICIDFMHLPMGLSQPEIDSLISSTHFIFPAALIDFPYHILQRVSIELFGVSLFSLRLPSIILAILSGILIIVNLKRFFRSSTALSAGLIILSSTLFLGVARDGSPMISLVFLVNLGLYTLSHFIENHKMQWLLLSVLSITIAIYSPLGVYFLIAGILVAIFNKKLRQSLSEVKVYWKILITILILAGISPLVMAIFYDINILLKLFGINMYEPMSLSLNSALSNVRAIFLPSSENFFFATPLIGLVTTSIAIIGMVVGLSRIKAPRTIAMIAFTVLFLVLSALNKNNVYAILIPITFLVAAGVDFLIQNWYGFFPKNPVARLVGMIPLSILTLGIMLTNYNRYIDNNFYNPSLVYSNNYSYMAANDVIKNRSAHKINLVTLEKDIPLYETLKYNHNDLTVSEKISKEKGVVNIVTPSSFEVTDKIPTQIIAGWTMKDNELLRIYDN